MDLQVFVRHIAERETPAVRQFAEEKVTLALERFNERVLSAIVRVEDETGTAKHGVDKMCSIEVKLRNSDIHIKEHGAEINATIDIAVDRLRAALSREVGRAKRGVAEG